MSSIQAVPASATPDEVPVRAVFNTLIRPYLVCCVGFVLLITVVGIPLAIIWFCGVGQWWARHYYDKLDCELDSRTLRFRKGILFQVEKTIPLENIQDVTFIEGPILRQFNLSLLRFETAGQSTNANGEMQLIGIIGAHQFRTQILATRDALRRSRDQPKTTSADEQLILLRRIAANLDRVVQHLDRRPDIDTNG